MRGSSDMLNEIFGFLSGQVIVHKIALLSKRVRRNLEKYLAFAPNRKIVISTRQFF